MSICPLEWDDESKIGSKLVKGGKVGGMKGGGLDSEGGGGGTDMFLVLLRFYHAAVLIPESM